jgi:hypothetical protein
MHYLSVLKYSRFIFKTKLRVIFICLRIGGAVLVYEMCTRSLEPMKISHHIVVLILLPAT